MSMNTEELTRFLTSGPFGGYAIESIEAESLNVTLRREALEARPGGTISGPSIAKAADVVSWMLIVALDGLHSVMSFTVNMNISFLRAIEPEDLRLSASLVGRSKRLATVVVNVQPLHEQAPIALVTVVYSIPKPQAQDAARNIELSRDEIAPLTGVYRFESPLDKTAAIMARDGHIEMVELDNATGARVGATLQLTAKAGGEFSGVEFPTRITFVRGPDGKVTGLQQTAFGQTFIAKRQDPTRS